MKLLVGTIPNLPWWRLKNMTDKKIEKFNRKGVFKMSEKLIPLNNREADIANMRYVEGWNAAIDKAIEEYNSKSHIMLPFVGRLSLLKK